MKRNNVPEKGGRQEGGILREEKRREIEWKFSRAMLCIPVICLFLYAFVSIWVDFSDGYFRAIMQAGIGVGGAVLLLAVLLVEKMVYLVMVLAVKFALWDKALKWSFKTEVELPGEGEIFDAVQD
jgi:hypothetical protein